jgi:hypothetical protein
MKLRVHRLLGHAILCAGLAVVASCSRPSPLPESTLAPAGVQSGNQAQTSLDAVAFPLLAGSFAIVNRNGDGIDGTYSGTATFTDGGLERSSLTLHIASGSGAYAGAAGTLAMSGVGAFAGEGAFSLDGTGEVVLAGGRRAVVVVNLRGTSVAGCSPSERIAITQTAGGTLSRVGRVTATLTHEVGETGCIF